MDEISDLEFGQSGRDRSFLGLMAIASSLILLAAMVPIPAKIVDVLWICSFCLSGAIVIICLAVKTSWELSGFVALVNGLTFLRLTAQTAAARHIIKDQPGGILLGSTGSLLYLVGPLAILLGCLVLSVIILFAIFTSCQKITLASKGYLQVFPLKCMGIQTDLRLGVIDEDHADVLSKRVRIENRFFGGIQNASMLMRTEAVISIIILLTCLLLGTANRGQRAFEDVLNSVAPLAAGLSAFALVPALIVAMACGGMMSKRTLAVTSEANNQSHARKIKVIAIDSNAAIDEYGIEARPSGSAEEQVVEFEPVEALPAPADICCRNTNEYYEKLSNIINGIKKRPKIVLLASDKVHSLPVTVAVNIAIRLAQKRQKVLLVDTDEHRSAVAHVFDLDPERVQKKVQPSTLENLSVCCAPARKFNSFVRQAEVINHFDAVLVYTPDADMMRTAKINNNARPGAFYFGDQEDSEKTATKKLSFCEWLCVIPSIQSVIDGHSV